MARKKRLTPSRSVQYSEEDIRRRAYELYEARGRGDGHDLDDWLRAEQEIRNRKTHLAI